MLEGVRKGGGKGEREEAEKMKTRSKERSRKISKSLDGWKEQHK